MLRLGLGLETADNDQGEAEEKQHQRQPYLKAVRFTVNQYAPTDAGQRGDIVLHREKTGRMATVEEVADASVFLASPIARCEIVCSGRDGIYPDVLLGGPDLLSLVSLLRLVGKGPGSRL